MLVDPRNKRFVDPTANLRESTYHQLLAEFPDLTRSPVFGEGRHKTSGPLVYSKTPRPNRLKQVKAEMMLEQGVIVIEESVGIVPDVHPCTSSPKKTEDYDRAATTGR